MYIVYITHILMPSETFTTIVVIIYENFRFVSSCGDTWTAEGAHARAALMFGQLMILFGCYKGHPLVLREQESCFYI